MSTLSKDRHKGKLDPMVPVRGWLMLQQKQTERVANYSCPKETEGCGGQQATEAGVRQASGQEQEASEAAKQDTCRAS